MDRNNDTIGCINVEVFSITQPLNVSCFPITKEVEMSCVTLTEPLRISCFTICSVNKEGRYWMWDAGEILLWDNNVEIGL